MKAVRIQFVAPRAWKTIWLSTAAILLAVVGMTGWHMWHQWQIQLGLQAELARWQAALQSRSPVVLPKADPREASERVARDLLRHDWNTWFDTIENPVLARVRLVQMTVDAASGKATLEYELEDFSQGAEVSRALNERGVRAWTMERLSRGGADRDAKVRGIWRSRPD